MENPSYVLFLTSLFAKFGEPRQALTADRLTKLDEAAGLDLANAFARYAVALGDLVEGARLAILEAETQFDHLALAGRQRPQHLGDALLQKMLIGVQAGVGGAGVVQEFPQGPLGVVAHGFVNA